MVQKRKQHFFKNLVFPHKLMMAETIPKLEIKNPLNLIIEIKETQRELDKPHIELRVGLHYPCHEDGVDFPRHKFEVMGLYEVIQKYSLNRVIIVLHNYGNNVILNLHLETKQMQDYYQYQIGLIKEIGNRLNISQLRLLGNKGRPF